MASQSTSQSPLSAYSNISSPSALLTYDSSKIRNIPVSELSDLLREDWQRGNVDHIDIVTHVLDAFNEANLPNRESEFWYWDQAYRLTAQARQKRGALGQILDSRGAPIYHHWMKMDKAMRASILKQIRRDIPVKHRPDIYAFRQFCSGNL